MQDDATSTPQYDKRKSWHATSTPSQKHGLIEQWTMIEETIEKYRETNPFRKEMGGRSNGIF